MEERFQPPRPGAPLDALPAFIQSIRERNHGLGFLFSPHEEEGAGLYDPRSIEDRFQAGHKAVRTLPEVEGLLSDLFEPNADLGLCLKALETFLGKTASQPDHERHVRAVLEATLACLLERMTGGGDRDFHPQALRHILSYFSERTPQFLLVIGSLFRILAEQDNFALEARGRAARTLINNYDIEAILIYLSCNPVLSEKEKDLIFPWVITFQKIYRRLQEILHNRKQDKVHVAEAWFGSTVSRLKNAGAVPVKDYQVPDFVRGYLSALLKGDSAAYLRTARALVLMINNEDILRLIHRINRDEPYSLDAQGIIEMYRTLYQVMQEYRLICTGQKASERRIKGRFASISRERREVEEITSAANGTRGKTPILGRRGVHELLSETERNLKTDNLHHLYEIWPIPPASQDVFNAVCRLKEQLPHEPDIQFNQILYQQKILEFLMRLNRLGIQVTQDPRLPLITNAFQLNAFGFIRKRLYIGSTGCWQCPNQIPPSVICCTTPHAIINCVGHKVRHVFLRVFLGTGEFYESPFILDSTLRYGTVDEEGLLDGLVFRPGLFLLDVPDAIVREWGEVQERQLSAGLEKRITGRVAYENMALPTPAFTAGG